MQEHPMVSRGGRAVMRKAMTLRLAVAMAISALGAASHAACKVDPAYEAIARATGGSILCANRATMGQEVMLPGQVAEDPLLGGYELADGRLEILAGWQVLGHGSLDSYAYRDLSRLPRDRIRVVLRHFPVDKGSITRVYAVSDKGRAGIDAVMVRDGAKSAPANGQGFFEFRVKPLSTPFHIAVEGITSTGRPFVLYSKDVMQVSPLTDREIGMAFWADTFRKHGNGFSERDKNELLKAAFAQN